MVKPEPKVVKKLSHFWTKFILFWKLKCCGIQKSPSASNFSAGFNFNVTLYIYNEFFSFLKSFNEKKNHCLFTAPFLLHLRHKTASFPPSPPWARECGEGKTPNQFPSPPPPYPIFLPKSGPTCTYPYAFIERASHLRALQRNCRKN